MRRSLLWLGGLGLGAGLMYLLDPSAGRRRRTLLRNLAIRATRQMIRWSEVGRRHARNRIEGLAAEASRRLVADQSSDRELVERVRSKLGHWATQPRSIEVLAQNGCVTLRGSILAKELEDVLSAVAAVPGVARVDHQLDVRRPPQAASGNHPPR